MKFVKYLLIIGFVVISVMCYLLNKENDYYVALINKTFEGKELGVVQGRSMYPLIKGGDTFVYNKEVKFEELNIGDIIVFRKDGTNVIHQVVGRVGDGLITKGSGNPITDQWVVKKEDLLGRVTIILLSGSFANKLNKYNWEN